MANLRIPGPTPLPAQVLTSLSQQVISHRGKSFEKVYQDVVTNLQYFFQTKNPIYLLTASGTAGLETAIVNFFSPGDTVIFFTCGEFGNRWAEIGRRYGLNVNQVKFPEGTAVKKEVVQKTLEKTKNLAAVFITHNETSSGVLNDIKSIAPFIHTHPGKPLFLVDSISAMGAVNLPLDEWGIDVAVTASQKAWMAPPGIAMISVSPKARAREVHAKMPKYYFDLSLYREFSAKNQTPATPAVGVLFGLDKALSDMRKIGREKIFIKHLELRDYLRQGLRKLRLELFVPDKDASPTVTSIVIPQAIDYHRWLEILREKYGVVLAGGMGETKGKIIRVAHMGNVSLQDIKEVMAALKKSLQEI